MLPTGPPPPLPKKPSESPGTSKKPTDSPPLPKKPSESPRRRPSDVHTDNRRVSLGYQTDSEDSRQQSVGASSPRMGRRPDPPADVPVMSPRQSPPPHAPSSPPPSHPPPSHSPRAVEEDGSHPKSPRKEDSFSGAVPKSPRLAQLLSSSSLLIKVGTIGRFVVVLCSRRPPLGRCGSRA